MSEEIIRIGSRSYGKTFDEYWNRIIKLEQENKQLNSILTELEGYLSEKWNVVSESPKGSFYEGYDTCMQEIKKDIQDKIQQLKEKYK